MFNRGTLRSPLVIPVHSARACLKTTSSTGEEGTWYPDPARVIKWLESLMCVPLASSDCFSPAYGDAIDGTTLDAIPEEEGDELVGTVALWNEAWFEHLAQVKDEEVSTPQLQFKTKKARKHHKKRLARLRHGSYSPEPPATGRGNATLDSVVQAEKARSRRRGNTASSVPSLSSEGTSESGEDQGDYSWLVEELTRSKPRFLVLDCRPLKEVC